MRGLITRCAGAIVALLCAAPFVLGQGAVTGNVPRIVCDQPVYNFGQARTDQPVVHTFILRNAGTAPLDIAAVHTSCGCTTAALGNKHVAPGQDTQITATLSLKSRGPQRKSIQVDSNDPLTPVYRLELSGTAVAEIDVEPPSVDFGRVNELDVAERSVTVVGTSNVAFHITGVQLNSPSFTVGVETNQAGHAYQLTLAYDPGYAQGFCSAALIINTDHPRMPVVTVPVRAVVAAEVIAVPRALVFPAAGGARPATAVVTVYAPENKPFKVLGVVPPRPEIQAVVRELYASRYLISVSNVVADAELDGQTLRIRTDCPSVPEIAVPLRVTGVASPTNTVPAGAPAPGR